MHVDGAYSARSKDSVRALAVHAVRASVSAAGKQACAVHAGGILCQADTQQDSILITRASPGQAATGRARSNLVTSKNVQSRSILATCRAAQWCHWRASSLNLLDLT